MPDGVASDLCLWQKANMNVTTKGRHFRTVPLLNFECTLFSNIATHQRLSSPQGTEIRTGHFYSVSIYSFSDVASFRTSAQYVLPQQNNHVFQLSRLQSLNGLELEQLSVGSDSRSRLAFPFRLTRLKED